jgi:hypothetical protein
MRRTRSLTLALVALAATVPALHAQHTEHATFDGTWLLTFETQMGAAEWTVELVVEEHAITGVAVTEIGNMPIEGTQDGNEVEFILFLNAPDHAVEFMFSGTLDGDTAEGSVTIIDETFGWTGKRTDGR